MFGCGMVTFTGVEGGINTATAERASLWSSDDGILSRVLWMLSRRCIRIKKSIEADY